MREGRFSQEDFIDTQFLQFLIFTIFTAIVEGTQQCRMSLCTTQQVSYQHAFEISMISHFSFSEGACYSKFQEIDIAQFSGVYCPVNFFCGLDLIPEKRGEKGLKFNQSAECFLFAKTEEGCGQLGKELIGNG